MAKSIQIKDWFHIHNGFRLEIDTGYTALVGPNGAGKTTILRQLEEQAKDAGAHVFRYDNLNEGGAVARQRYEFQGDVVLMATVMTSSEGEQIAINFGNTVRKLGTAVKQAAKAGKPIFILLDALDSGASIDRIREVRGLFNLISKDAADVYIIAACNSYEMAKGADCVDVRTGEHLRFPDYETYADFICRYFEEHPRETVN